MLRAKIFCDIAKKKKKQMIYEKTLQYRYFTQKEMQKLKKIVLS